MKIFSDNADSIKKELEIIKDSFGKTNFRKITDNIEMLAAFCKVLKDVTGEKDLDAEYMLNKNEKYVDIKYQNRRAMEKKVMQNFIANKDFHKSFSGKMIDIHDRDFKYYI